ncbi:MAG: hypothetical protein ACRD38_11735 [Nitrososphaerales archaeon]
MKNYADIDFPQDVQVMVHRDWSEIMFMEHLLPLVFSLLRNKGYMKFDINIFGDVIIMTAWTESDLESQEWLYEGDYSIAE